MDKKANSVGGNKFGGINWSIVIVSGVNCEFITGKGIVRGGGPRTRPPPTEIDVGNGQNNNEHKETACPTEGTRSVGLRSLGHRQSVKHMRGVLMVA